MIFKNIEELTEEIQCDTILVYKHEIFFVLYVDRLSKNGIEFLFNDCDYASYTLEEVRKEFKYFMELNFDKIQIVEKELDND